MPVFSGFLELPYSEKFFQPQANPHAGRQFHGFKRYYIGRGPPVKRASSASNCLADGSKSALSEKRLKLISTKKGSSIMLRFPQQGHDGRAKDGEARMSLEVSEPVGGVERVAGGWVACSQSLAAAGAAGGHSLRPGTPHRYLLAPRRRCERRLPRLLLLPCPTGTQDQIGRHAAFDAPVADLAASRSAAGGDRRLAYQTLRAEGRRGRHPSQPHSGTGRSNLLVRTHLGHPLAGSAASALRRVGPAAASDALRPPEDHSHNPQVSPMEVLHQAPPGGTTGRMDRSDRENGGQNTVGRRRWRLHQASLPEAGVEGRRGRGRSFAQGRCVAGPAAEVEKRSTSASRPATQVRQEPNQPGQTGRTPARMANDRVPLVQRNGDQDLQNVLGDLSAGRRRDSRGAGQGGSWLVRLLLDRSERERGGDPRSVRRPGDHRTGLPRREGSVGRRPAAGAEHLDQCGRLSSQLVDAYAGRIMGLGPLSPGALRPPRFTLGRRRATAFPRESSQSLTPSDPAKRIIDDYPRVAFATKNHPVGQEPHGSGGLT